MLSRAVVSTSLPASVEVVIVVVAEEIHDQAAIVVVAMVAEDGVAITVEERETKIIRSI